jgi:hypothetical protein
MNRTGNFALKKNKASRAVHTVMPRSQIGNRENYPERLRRTKLPNLRQVAPWFDGTATAAVKPIIDALKSELR